MENFITACKKVSLNDWPSFLVWGDGQKLNLSYRTRGLNITKQIDWIGGITQVYSLNFKKFSEACKGTRNTSVKIENQCLRVNGISLPLVNADMPWPVIPEINFSWTPIGLLQAMANVEYIAKSNEARAYGTVVHISKDDIVATDGFRLARTILGDNIPEKLTNICIPINSVKVLMAYKHYEHIQYAMEDGTLYFKVEDCFIAMKLSMVKFPNYSGILPTKYSFSVGVNAAQLAKIVNRAVVFSKTEKKEYILSLDITPESLIIQASEFKDYISLANNPVVNVRYSLNAKFLLAALKSYKNLDITINCNGPDDSILLKHKNFETLLVPRID